MFDAIQSSSFLFTRIFFTSATLTIITLDISPAVEGDITNENDKHRAIAPKNTRI
jgi:hypothetical protein